MTVTNLEQSRWLKSVGAPQNTEFQWFKKVVGEGWYLLHEDSDQFSGGEDGIAAYDLESLIGWLGNDFRAVEKGDVNFWAGVSNIKKESHGIYGRVFREGNTPLEAVFALAEAIHGKENNE